MKLSIQPIKSSTNVIDFPVALVVLPLAQPRAAKIETQHRETAAVQRLHGVEHDLVVQSAAKQRVWMAHQRRMRRVLRARVKQRLQPAGGALKK